MTDLVATHRISEAAIARMLAAAVEQARDLEAAVGIGIVDEGGHLRAWILMDGAAPVAFDSMLKKARTAAFLGIDSGVVPEPSAMNLALAIDDFTNLHGGFAILKDGRPIGAIAASGSSGEIDAQIARAGLAALRLG